MALSFIGKPISLISHSDVRYRGILAGIDAAQSTIQLSNVYSMGTEGRRPAQEFIPPVAEPYEYIIFRASEVKDLSVDEVQPAVPQNRNIHDDPAVVNAGTRLGQQPQSHQPNVPQPPQQRRSNSVHTASASMQTIERAIGDLRQPPSTHKIKVPHTDFDFESSNAKFNKPTSPAETEEDEEAYNPNKSFFDTLSPGPTNHVNGGRGQGGRGRGRGRRQEERDRNVATFGEPGGVGLMGPGAYVGGWGGYGGGRRGRGSHGQGQGRGRHVQQVAR